MEFLKRINFLQEKQPEKVHVNPEDITFVEDGEVNEKSLTGMFRMEMRGKDDDLIGAVGFDRSDTSLILKTMYIFDKYQGQGLSKKFLQQFIDLAHEKGLAGVEVGSNIQNEYMAKAIKNFIPDKTTEEIIKASKDRTLGVIKNLE